VAEAPSLFSAECLLFNPCPASDVRVNYFLAKGFPGLTHGVTHTTN